MAVSGYCDLVVGERRRIRSVQAESAPVSTGCAGRLGMRRVTAAAIAAGDGGVVQGESESRQARTVCLATGRDVEPGGQESFRLHPAQLPARANLSEPGLGRRS